MARGQIAVDQPVDLNSASLAELVLLIGISETIAESIIDFRDANGGFDRVEDLLEVAFISESSYERIRPRVTV
jgi:competence ComEA-like helix-hairpin-helix protein